MRAYHFRPKEAAKNRLVSPTKVLHFFKLSREIDTKEKLMDIFAKAEAPVPVACDFMTTPPGRVSRSGHMVSSCSLFHPSAAGDSSGGGLWLRVTAPAAVHLVDLRTRPSFDSLQELFILLVSFKNL